MFQLFYIYVKITNIFYFIIYKVHPSSVSFFKSQVKINNKPYVIIELICNFIIFHIYFLYFIHNVSIIIYVFKKNLCIILYHRYDAHPPSVSFFKS